MAEALDSPVRCCVECGADFMRSVGRGRPRTKCGGCSPTVATGRSAKALRHCEECGGPFLGIASARVCSSACRQSRQRTAKGGRTWGEFLADAAAARQDRWRDHKCTGCGEPFTPKRLENSRFCSRLCAATHTKNTPARVVGRANGAAKRAKQARERRTRRLALLAETGAIATMPKTVAAGFANLATLRRRKARAINGCADCGSKTNRHWRATYCEPCSDSRAKEQKATAREARKARQRLVKVESVSPRRVFERDGWRCHLCGGKAPQRLRGTYHPKAPELDHIVPLAKGGAHSYANTACSHRACNAAKSDNIRGQPSLLAA